MSEASFYREAAPRAGLAEFVHCVWFFEARAPDPEPQRIAPDGRAELIVHIGAPHAERGDLGDHVQPPILFAGQLTAPLTLVAIGPPAVLGVRFRPDGARAFLGHDADIATDKRIDLTHWDGAEELLEAARAARDWERRMALAQDFVAARVQDAHLDALVRAEVTRLLDGGEPHGGEGVSERQMQRRFKAEVGVSPRLLQSILRFRRVFDAIEHPQTSGWVEAALAAGYFDQPQMARDFRRFLGCTAREWARQRAGLAKALTAAPETYKKRRGGADT